MAGRESRKATIAAQEAEIASLRSVLAEHGLAPPPVVAPLAINDTGIEALDAAFQNRAYTALVKHQGGVYYALQELGYALEGKSLEEVKALAIEVFGAPGIAKRVVATFSDLAAKKDDVLASMMQLAILSDDPAMRIRAAEFVARCGGYYAPMKVSVNSKTMNMHQVMMSDEYRKMLAEHFNHVPGAAAKVWSEATEEPVALTATQPVNDDPDAD